MQVLILALHLTLGGLPGGMLATTQDVAPGEAPPAVRYARDTPRDQLPTADELIAAIHAAAHRAGLGHRAAEMVRVVACESNTLGSRPDGRAFDPRAVGDGGLSEGLVQLHERGLRAAFYARGGTNHFDPYEAIEFLADAWRRGERHHWSC